MTSKDVNAQEFKFPLFKTALGMFFYKDEILIKDVWYLYYQIRSFKNKSSFEKSHLWPCILSVQSCRIITDENRDLEIIKAYLMVEWSSQDLVNLKNEYWKTCYDIKILKMDEKAE